MCSQVLTVFFTSQPKPQWKWAPVSWGTRMNEWPAYDMLRGTGQLGHGLGTGAFRDHTSSKVINTYYCVLTYCVPNWNLGKRNVGSNIICHKMYNIQTIILPKRDYVTFGHLLSQIRLSSDSSVTFVHPTQSVKIFSNVLKPFCSLTIGWSSCKSLRRSSQGNRGG